MQVDTALHELGHSIGLHHEQNRRDRDDYIWVRSEYMDPKYRFASDMENEEDITNYGIAYDYGSIMHYGQDVSMSWTNRSCNTGPILFSRYDVAARLLDNDSAAFNESCAAIGWKGYDSIRST